ncbi:MAG: hypothetical protein MZV63_21545 [Marinilabiliales bacterium]|nr:hypothetical protein [Marinilabiliales bacterium]
MPGLPRQHDGGRQRLLAQRSRAGALHRGWRTSTPTPTRRACPGPTSRAAAPATPATLQPATWPEHSRDHRQPARRAGNARQHPPAAGVPQQPTPTRSRSCRPTSASLKNVDHSGGQPRRRAPTRSSTG